MRKGYSVFSLILSLSLTLAGCAIGNEPSSASSSIPSNGQTQTNSPSVDSVSANQPESQPESLPENPIPLDRHITQLEPGLSAVRFDGDYGFDEFLEQGGASSDGEVAQYLVENMAGEMGLDFLGKIFGCSTLAVSSPDGDILFGRNFDWNTCNAMIVEAHPENGYASLSTVNMDFITQGAGSTMGAVMKLEQVQTLAALYAPLDGMNEAGLAVSVNMIQDSTNISQNTGKPGITTTTAIRLLLDKAASVDEALELLGQYDLYASMGYMVHFAIADCFGRSVAVEYINNEAVMIETPVLTNFYLAPGEKNGIGTQQSHQRFEILTDLLSQNRFLAEIGVRDALSSVSKGNFGEFESTEWSIIMNLTNKTARYFHRENYENSYLFSL